MTTKDERVDLRIVAVNTALSLNNAFSLTESPSKLKCEDLLTDADKIYQYIINGKKE